MSEAERALLSVETRSCGGGRNKLHMTPQASLRYLHQDYLQKEVKSPET